MKIEHLTEFAVLARYLNFSVAAKKLYLTQPSLSSHIQSMESELRVELFDRGAELSLTPAGSSFLQNAQRLLAEYEAAVEECRLAAKTSIGKLVIQESPLITTAYQYLMDVVAQFKLERPDIEVELVPKGNVGLVDDLLDGRVDCGIMPMASHYGGDAVELVEIRTGLSSPMLLWVDRNSPLATKSPLHLRDLDGCTCPVTSKMIVNEYRYSYAAICEREGIRLDVPERQANTISDFYMNCIGPGDLCIVDSGDSLLPLMRTRQDRVLRTFDDKDNLVREYLCYRRGNEKSTLRDFLEFFALHSGGTAPDAGVWEQ